MTTLLTIMIVVVSLLLITIVLIQNPKGGGVDSNFGGTASNQMFGAAKSADFVEKATWGLAAALFVLCIIATLTLGTGAEAEVLLPSQQ